MYAESNSIVWDKWSPLKVKFLIKILSLASSQSLYGQTGIQYSTPVLTGKNALTNQLLEHSSKTVSLATAGYLFASIPLRENNIFPFVASGSGYNHTQLLEYLGGKLDYLGSFKENYSF